MVKKTGKKQEQDEKSSMKEKRKINDTKWEGKDTIETGSRKREAKRNGNSDRTVNKKQNRQREESRRKLNKKVRDNIGRKEK